MDYEFILGEIVSILHASKLNKEDGAKALDAAHKKVYVTDTRISCCPYCKTIFSYEVPAVSLTVNTKCADCQRTLLVVTGTVKSKRFNGNYFSMDKGLYIRFMDSALRERYAALWGFERPAELKSKDIFSLCIGADNEIVTQNRESRRGIASVINLTLNNEPVIAEFWKSNEILHALQGLKFIPTIEDSKK